MRYLTPAQYAKAYGISRQRVHYRIKNKLLPLKMIKVEVGHIPIEDKAYEEIKDKLE